jgi:hypothetical protein
MKDFFKKIFNLLNFDGRDWAVLLLALLLAFSIWVIHNLALKYSGNLQVSIVAVSNIQGHSSKSINSCVVTARCQATGYKHLIHSFRDIEKSVEVKFPASLLKHKSGDVYYILASELNEYSGKIFSNGISVDYFNADTLFYRFPFEENRKVPVEPVLSLECRQQYMLDGDVHITPDSITIYGEPARLKEIASIKTMPIRHSDIHSDMANTIELETMQGVRPSESEVTYSINVVRFTELRAVAPITSVNVPDGKLLSVYPSVAQVNIKYEFPPVPGFNEDVRLLVDYNDFQQSLSGKCKVKLITPDDGVISYTVNPPYVECIVEGI